MGTAAASLPPHATFATAKKRQNLKFPSGFLVFPNGFLGGYKWLLGVSKCHFFQLLVFISYFRPWI